MSRTEAVETMDRGMYWNVHPDDVQRVVAVAVGFIKEDKPNNLVCRVRAENGYRLIHIRGRYITAETGEYTEFGASTGYEGLGIARQGSDFFKTTNKSSLGTIHPWDLGLFRAQVTEEWINGRIAKGERNRLRSRPVISTA